jgi:hypothetical protein
MKFELEPHHRNVSDEELLQDVRDVAKRTGRATVTMDEYARFGTFHPSTLQRHFHSWFRVLEMAGLQASRSQLNIPEDELFDNIRDMWISLGRQPKYAEIKKPFSKFSGSTYENRFDSWRKALEAFVAYINAGVTEEEAEARDASDPVEEARGKTRRRRTKREISERLRFSILLRDGFRCQACGRSPITSPGVELQVDHILPWSRGGETVSGNLQTKCIECNQGKGNAFDK